MVVFGELTLKSGLRYQVEIYNIQSGSSNGINGGKFKNDSILSEQLEKDAKRYGSWQAIQEMSIEFEYNNKNHVYSILTSIPTSEFLTFKVVSGNKA